MKFLNKNMEGKNLMPLTFNYHRGDFKRFDDDVLEILYKDLDTGKKYLETIFNPLIEIWVVKPEHRTYTYYKDFIPKEICDCYKVHYKTRFSEIGKIMGIPSNQVKTSVYVSQTDMDIRHFYMMEFVREYPTKEKLTIDIAGLDIETDIININHFPEPGEVPVNLISIMDYQTKQFYVLVNINNNVQHLSEDHKMYDFYEGLREKFKENIKEFQDSLDDGSFVQDLHDSFDDVYGKIDYNLLVFDDELKMLEVTFNILNTLNIDILEIWNAPFDACYLPERIKVLGGNPDEIIIDPLYKNNQVEHHVYTKEDKNPLAHKRKHIFDYFTCYQVICQMALYAGVRSGRGKIPSLKLNAIGMKEFNDSKIDYGEYGNIRMFPYYNFKMFTKYNIKDVLLQYGINSRTNDVITLYSIMYEDCVLINETFTSTTILTNSLRIFALSPEFNWVMGVNRNKLFEAIKCKYERGLNSINEGGINIDLNELGNDDEDFDLDPDEIDYADNEDDEEGLSEEQKKKKNKFLGAFVMSPVHMSSSGAIVSGSEAKYIHRHVIDEDIASMYPTGINIMNASNESLIAKVYFERPEDIRLPVYENMYFVDKEDEENYHKTEKNPAVAMLEIYTENDPINFANIFLNLPNATELLSILSDHIDELQ